jgi:hypothetical protein
LLLFVCLLAIVLCTLLIRGWLSMFILDM